eukprot:1176766-Prorocentrum_minimum.AAC.1
MDDPSLFPYSIATGLTRGGRGRAVYRCTAAPGSPAHSPLRLPALMGSANIERTESANRPVAGTNRIRGERIDP